MSNVNLPRRTRGDLVAAARAGATRETLPEHEEKRRKRLEEREPHTLTAPVERNKGNVHRVEIDTDHFTVLHTIALLAERWAGRLEETGLPAMQPKEWAVFAQSIQNFRTLQQHVGMWNPGEASAVLELLSMRDDLAGG